MGIHHCVSIRMNLTNAFSRSIESFFSVSNKKVDGGEAVQKKRKEADLDGEVEYEIKKMTLFALLPKISSIVFFLKRDAPCHLQRNCHFHFLNFPTVSSLLHIRKILVHWPFLEISGPQKWVVGPLWPSSRNFCLEHCIRPFFLHTFPFFTHKLSDNLHFCHPPYHYFNISFLTGI